jgi:hypothetical protein
VGELVVVQIADFPFTLEFDGALILSAAIRVNARLAKLNAGMRGHGFHCAGVLHNAAASAKRRERFAAKLPELLRQRNLAVATEGQLVTVTIGRTTVKIPFDNARSFAQWLRVRGKEAKHNAGEHAHWSTFVKGNLWHAIQ